MFLRFNASKVGLAITIDIVFNDIWKKFNLTDKITKKNIVLANNFVTDLAKLYWSSNDIPMDALVFYDKSNDDKYLELWQIINMNSVTLEKININIDEKYNQIISLLYKIFGFIILMNLIINLISQSI